MTRNDFIVDFGVGGVSVWESNLAAEGASPMRPSMIPSLWLPPSLRYSKFCFRVFPLNLKGVEKEVQTPLEKDWPLKCSR